MSLLPCLSCFLIQPLGTDYHRSNLGGYWANLVYRHCIGMVTLIGTLGVYASVNKPEQPAQAPGQTSPPSLSPSGEPTPGVGWQITTTSGESEIALASP